MKAMKPLVVLFLASTFLPLAADEFDRWTWRVPSPPSILWQKVVFAEGQFVAVGDVGSIMTSTNGRDWALEDTVTTNRLLNVFHGGQYVASGDRGTVVASPDARRWQLASFPNDHRILALAHGNGVYAVLDVYGNFFQSTNALQWTPVLPPAPTTGADMAFGGGQFVMVGAAGLIMTSTNGLDWVQRESGTTGSFLAVAYGDDRFVAVGSEGDDNGNAHSFILFSYNAIDWFYQALDTALLPRDVTYADGRFVIVGGGGFGSPTLSLVSDDGLYFDSAEGDNGLGTSRVNGVACGNGVCVAVGDGVFNSDDGGLTWTSVNSGTLEPINAFASRGNTVVGVGYGGTIATTLDGITWTNQLVREDVNWNSVADSGSLFVAVGYRGGLATSPDGLTWTSIGETNNAGFMAIAHGGGRYVVVARGETNPNYGYFLTSTDGIDWEERRPFNNTYYSYSIAYGAGRFVVLDGGGNQLGRYYHSTDGVNWQAANTGYNLHGQPIKVFFRNNQFLAFNSSSGLFTSPDGLTWSQHTIGLPDAPRSVSHGNGAYLATRSSPPALWSSADGLNWQAESIGVNSLLSSEYAHDAFYVSGAVLQSQSSLIPSLERVFRDGGALNAEVFGRIGREYELQSSPNLTDWEHEADYTQSVRHHPLTLPTGPDQRFYRVKLKE
jgi:hypothetical protein